MTENTCPFAVLKVVERALIPFNPYLACPELFAAPDRGLVCGIYSLFIRPMFGKLLPYYTLPD